MTPGQARSTTAGPTNAIGLPALCLSRIHRQRQLNQPSNLNDIAKYLHQFGEQLKQTTQQFLNEMAEERKAGEARAEQRKREKNALIAF